MTTSDRAVHLADRIERGEAVRVGGALMSQEVRSELERRGIAHTETLSVHGGIGRIIQRDGPGRRAPPHNPTQGGCEMREKTSDIRPLAREIARHFGQGWTMEEAPPDWGEQVRTRAYLVHEDGRRIVLLAQWGPGGKIHVCGDYGEDNGRRVYPKDVGAIGWDEKAPAINVSPHRGAEAVAKDIARRFLPRYTEVWTRCREKIEGRREYRRRAKENAERIAKAIGAAPGDVRAHEGGDAYTIYVRATDLQHGRIEVSGSYAEIRVSVKDMDAAEKIARALRDN